MKKSITNNKHQSSNLATPKCHLKLKPKQNENTTAATAAILKPTQIDPFVENKKQKNGFRRRDLATK
jgi:hypothetical protein